MKYLYDIKEIIKWDITKPFMEVKKAKLKEYHLKIQVKDGSFIKKADMIFEDLSKKYPKNKSVYYH